MTDINSPISTVVTMLWFSILIYEVNIICCKIDRIQCHRLSFIGNSFLSRYKSSPLIHNLNNKRSKLLHIS